MGKKPKRREWLGERGGWGKAGGGRAGLAGRRNISTRYTPKRFRKGEGREKNRKKEFSINIAALKHPPSATASSYYCCQPSVASSVVLASTK